MPKSKSLIYILSVLTILFCLHSIDSSLAGDCGEKGDGAGTSTVSGNYVYPPGYVCTEDPDLEYDSVNSHETINRNGSAVLFVIGNNAPYTWSVSGTGFSLESEGEPIGPTNTLYADGTACGAATITVIGCSGPPVKGYVRCTTGQWGPWQNICGTFSQGFYLNSCCDKIEGNRWYRAYCNAKAGPVCCGVLEEGCVSEGVCFPSAWALCCPDPPDLYGENWPHGISHTRETFWECF